MAKAYYDYTAKNGIFSFLQDTAIAAAVGNTPSPVGRPRLPHKLKPRQFTTRTGTGPYTYRRFTYGPDDDFAGVGVGATVLGGVVVGFSYGHDDSASAY